ncbi:LPS export ABC transporter periplasmic protein LptC [uncultured Bacteroides sp.]|jgi:LPS export ABC transporter protein LptC|uniref:LPS export ABC transporter periplasmic protein LptC n=1 Tax=uncultured Bacteroides sp. TaxID=162156 RepID=UPI0025CCE49F|nr:LPS export ABC transporter periplasmic protein LptC [uncultured Bacteroides sp.]
MLRKRTKRLFHTNLSITIVLGAIVMLLLFPSCGGKKKAVGEAITERDSLPIMSTAGISTLISDSGVTRYRMNAEEWQVFDRKKPSYWAFEKGVYLEQFDSVFHVEASIKADTAYYYDKQRLWKLVGNVDIQNRKGERFNTELLYWNEATQKVYSDRDIRIQQPDRTIIGHGFDSNQQMTVYTIRNIEGIFYVDDEASASQPKDEAVLLDSVKNDSVK